MNPRELPERLRAALPSLDISQSGTVVRRRARTWSWPAFQMAIASALSWAVAARVAGDAASYAPIAAIVALGLGRERRLSRSALMIAGLFVGVIAAEILTPLIGSGWWQIGLVMGSTAVVTGALVGRDLAVTYATINAVVLLTTPGSEGWLPSRLVSGIVGVGAALVVLLVVAPPRPVHLIRHRVTEAARAAGDALRATATVLADPDAADGSDDERRLIRSARRLDDAIERTHEVVDQAREIVRWSPRRRRDADAVDHLAGVVSRTRPALRTASTIARLGDRAAVLGLVGSDALLDGICEAAEFVEERTRCLVERTAIDDDRAETVRHRVEALMDRSPDHAALIALVEEVRGILDDLAEIDTGTDDAIRFPGRRTDGIVFGNA